MNCAICKNHFPLTFKIAGNDFCLKCFVQEFIVCDICHNLESEADSYTAYEETLCKKCFNTHFFICDGCERTLPSRQKTAINHASYYMTRFCRTCYISYCARRFWRKKEGD